MMHRTIVGLLLALWLVLPALGQSRPSRLPRSLHTKTEAQAMPKGEPTPGEEPLPKEKAAEPAPLPPLMPTSPWEEYPQPGCAPKFITLPRVYLMEEQHETVKPKLKVREVEVGRARELEVFYREEKRKVVISSLKPRECERQIISTRVEPFESCDPCTGKTITTYKSVPYTRTVKVTVYDRVMEEREVVVKIPCLRPGGELSVKKLTVDGYSVPAVRKTYKAVKVGVEVPLNPIPLAPPLPPPPVCILP